MSKVLFRCEIPGRPIVKKNTQRVYGVGKSRRAVYSSKYLRWRDIALLEMRKAWDSFDPIEVKVNAKMVFCFKNMRSEPDLSNLYEGPQDVLQMAGVLKDDRLIYSHNGSTKLFGGAELTVIELTEAV